MKIVLVLHEASRTGAPRIGGLVASSLRSSFDVKLISLKDGPLWNWLSECAAGNIELVDRGPVHMSSFDFRVELATKYLEQHSCDLVYVNSLAASEYVVAGKQLGKKVVLHVHEKISEMRSLLRQQVTKFNILTLCDAVILAGDDLDRDMQEMFGGIPQRVLRWGIAVNYEEMIRLSLERPQDIRNVFGETLQENERLLVGMVGHASRRKGGDIFLDVAKSLPKCNFLWVGNWSSDEAPENAETSERLAQLGLPNVFLVGSVENPFKYIRKLDLFFLSSREDPNPVVIAEAMLLQVPIMCFSRATAVTAFLGRHALVLYGDADAEPAVKVIAEMNKRNLASGCFRVPLDTARSYFDIAEKGASICDFVRSI